MAAALPGPLLAAVVSADRRASNPTTSTTTASASATQAASGSVLLSDYSPARPATGNFGASNLKPDYCQCVPLAATASGKYRAYYRQYMISSMIFRPRLGRRDVSSLDPDSHWQSRPGARRHAELQITAIGAGPVFRT